MAEKKKVVDSLINVVQNIRVKTQKLDEYVKKQGVGKSGLNKILSQIQDGQNIVKVSIIVDQKRIQQSCEQFIKSHSGLNWFADQHFSWAFALLDPKYHALLELSTNDIFNAIKKLINSKKELTFSNIIKQGFRFCLSKHILFISLQDTIKSSRNKNEVSYTSKIDIKSITSNIKTNDDKSEEEGSYFKTCFDNYIAKRNNQRDPLTEWINNPEAVVKSINGKAQQKQIYGFCNYFNSYTKLAMMIQYLYQQIQSFTVKGNESIDITQDILAFFFSDIKGSSNQKQNIATHNGKYQYLFKNIIPNPFNQQKIRELKDPNLVFYSQLNVYNKNFLFSYNQSNSEQIKFIKVGEQQPLNYKQVSSQLNKCSDSFIRLLFLKYLFDIQKKKQTEPQKAKLWKKWRGGYSQWLKSGQIIEFKKQEE